MEKIKNIRINPNWYYHQITPERLKGIILSKGICSKRKCTIKLEEKQYRAEWNGDAYISLAKLNPDLTYESSYLRFIVAQYALILKDVDAQKTHFSTNSFLHYISKFPLPIRYSLWKDEYQAYDFIPLEHVVGIKLPEEELSYYWNEIRYFGETKNVDLFLEIMEELNIDLPFIDVEYQKKISKDQVKSYLKTKYKTSSGKMEQYHIK